jgi:hypothetical protein
MTRGLTKVKEPLRVIEPQHESGKKRGMIGNETATS